METLRQDSTWSYSQVSQYFKLFFVFIASMDQSHEPQLLRQLREKTMNLQLSIDKYSANKKQNSKILANLQEDLQRLVTQKQVQERKHKSLIVLLNQLQQAYQQAFLDSKQTEQNNEVLLSLENSFLRFLLIRESEHIKDGSKLLNLMKQMQLDRNKNKPKEFLQKSNFIEAQSELIAKLKSKISSLKNENLQCKRKWYHLQEDTRALQNNQKLLSIQNERQKINLRQQYEQYLERVNEAKMKIVNYNEIQKEAIITDYLVKQMAILQQKRVEIEEENANLKYHFENLSEELERIKIQNKELNGFFSQDNQGQLATKMKKRIDELRDNLIEAKKKGKNTRGSKLGKILQHLKREYKNLNEANDFMHLRAREQQNNGLCLDEKPIGQFFTKVLSQKDNALIQLKEEQNALYEVKKELEVRKALLQSQIQNLQQNIHDNNWQSAYKQKQVWSSNLQRKPVKSQAVQDKDWSKEWKSIARETDRIFGCDNFLQSK